MKKTFLKKIISAGVVAATIGTLVPLGVSAQGKIQASNWNQAADNTWSYCDGDTEAKGWKKISNTWYYFDDNGIMQTGWICDNGNWYYSDS